MKGILYPTTLESRLIMKVRRLSELKVSGYAVIQHISISSEQKFVCYYTFRVSKEDYPGYQL